MSANEIAVRRYGKTKMAKLTKAGIAVTGFSSYKRFYDNGSWGYESLVHYSSDATGYCVPESEFLALAN